MIDTVPLKRLVDERRPVTYGIVLPGPNQESGPLIIKGGDVKPHGLDPSRLCRTTPEIERAYARSRVRRGDIVIAIRGGVGDTALVPQKVAGANLTQDVARVAPASGVDTRWLHYCLQSAPVQAEVRARTTGATIRGLNIEQLDEVRVPLPPSHQGQREIADYLDAETARIDALIAKKQRLIDLLDERRLEATLAGVSGRLTHVGRFKDSTLHWTAQIPAHWNVGLLRLVARQGTGHTPSRDHAEWWLPEECVIPWVTTGEVQQVRSDRAQTIVETRERISPAGLANSSAVIHPKGTVFLCRTAASAGYSGIMGADMAVSQDIATWTCSDRLLPEYLLFCLRAMRRDLLDRLATGSTHRTIYMPEIQGIRVPVPPIDEQRVICERVREAVRRCFSAADALEQQTELLVEHRRALITAAVAGAGRNALQG